MTQNPEKFQILNIQNAKIAARQLLNYYWVKHIYSSKLEEILDSGCEWTFALNSIIAPKLRSVMSMGFYASVNLQFVTANRIDTLNTSSFSHCYNLKVVRMDNLVRIPSSCFHSCKTLQIGSFMKCTHIDSQAFGQCFLLQELRVPQLDKIADECVCTNQPTFQFNPPIDEDLFKYGVKISKSDYTPKTPTTQLRKRFEGLDYSLSVFKSSSVAIKMKSRIQHLYLVQLTRAETVEPEAFCSSYNLKFIVAGKLKHVKPRAFIECHSLELITGRLETVEADAFCFALNNLDLSRVQVLEDAFGRCYCLENVRCSEENKGIVRLVLPQAKCDAEIRSFCRFLFVGLVEKVKGRQREVYVKMKAVKKLSMQQ